MQTAPHFFFSENAVNRLKNEEQAWCTRIEKYKNMKS
jgi:hypothetical protein